MMRSCTIFSPFIYLDNLADIVNKVYWDKSFMIEITLTKINITLDSRDVTLNITTIDTDTYGFINMKRAMLSYYQALSTENKDIQNGLIKKISTLNMVISVIPLISDEITITIFSELLKLTKQIDGIILVEGGKLLDSTGKLILDSNGNSDLDNYKI
jgi:hypothetical protein